MRKPGQGLPLNTIVLAIIALLVLVFLILIFSGGMGRFTGGMTRYTTEGQVNASTCAAYASTLESALSNIYSDAIIEGTIRGSDYCKRGCPSILPRNFYLPTGGRVECSSSGNAGSCIIYTVENQQKASINCP